MIPKEVLKNIRRIEITTSRMVTDVFSGQYQSVFKGKGMEFNEVREYLPGDDVRSIDWNVTARFGHPFVKKFVEERELTVMLLVDLSKSTYFGTAGRLKKQIATELCSLLAFSAIKSNDKIGLIIFTDRIEKFVPPRKGVKHVLRIIREVLYYEPRGTATDIPLALEYLNKICKRKSVVFVISDFYAADFKKPLSIANKRHDVVAVTITDQGEVNLPSFGMVEFSDAETGETFYVDTSSKEVLDQFRKNSLKSLEERKKIFSSINVDSVNIYSGVSYIKELVKFFRMRERRKR